jgi:ribonuclease HI
MFYYAVAVGHKVGIFNKWEDCKKNIDNFKGPKYRKFDNEEDANNFILKYASKVDVNDKNDTDNKEIDKDILYIYTDGACYNNGSKNAKAGIGIYFSEDNVNNVSRELSGDKLTNNIAELSAVIEAINIIKKMDIKKKVIVTDSEYAIKCATTYGAKLEANEWKTSKDKIPPNIEFVKKLYELTNKYKINYKHVMAHTGNKDIHSIGNYNADKLANESISITTPNDGLFPPIKRKDNEKIIYLNVSFAEKDKAKAKGAKWNPEKKKWYIYDNNENKEELLKTYS